ncbi:actin-related protein 2/3 complex subunit 5 [Zopfochytrium polystomum]|nr:actin-related protein 2/3 complex subunit 5 [Zopfochytrium polystomum]
MEDNEYDDTISVPQSSGIDPAQLDAIVNNRATEVRNLLFRGANAQAVIASLQNPPFGLDPQPIKDKNTQIVMEALSSVNSAEIVNVVKQLTSAQLDLAMKFIYRGMASPDIYNPSVLLAWHEKVVEVGGLATITRVLTDRQPL